MEFQQPQNRYMRPPQPPPPSDPNHHQSSVVPPPPAPTWFSGQFQFHGHSPSPPPPNHNQQHWPPPPPPPPHDPYHAPPPYPAHHQYPLPPPPPRPTANQSYPPMPQSYPPQHNQDWHNPGWNQNQHLQHPALNNGEDWAAKAKAWAAAQTSVDNQYPQSHYAPVGRIEENQYSMVNPQYSDGQHYTGAASSYQQYQPPIAPPYQSSETSFSSGYVSEGHLPFNGRNGSLVGDSNAALPHQESYPPSLSVHQQEVPSSYSSVAGKEDNQNEQFYKPPWTFTSTSQQQAQPAAVGGTVSVEQPHYAFSHQSAEPPRDLSDQPLDFASGFTRDHDQHVQSNHSHNSGVPARGIDSPSAMASIHAWSSPVAPGVVYPSVHPPGPQVDTSLAIPSPVPGHFGQLFGRISGQNFQPMGPSVSVPFGGAGTYPGDGFGGSTVSDRPKKAVPNWLREEIIKKKAVIATSAPEYSEDTKSMEEVVDRSFVKGDPDSKSVDSPISTEEEDDEEHDVEIARTAAINQEIKRVLTEVLLKVTDELFNEIATKVLSEEVDHDNASPNHEVSPSAPAVPTPKASAKVLITGKPSEDDLVNSRKLATSAPGDLLGLASYASDDDEDDDVQNIGVPNSKRNMIHQPSTPKMLPDDLSEFGRMYRNGSTGNDSAVYNGEEDANKADISLSKDNIEKVVTKNECLVESVAAKKVISDDTEVTEARKQPDKFDKHDKRRSSSGKDIVKEAGGDKVYVGEDEIHRRHEERKVKKVKTDELDGSKERLKEQLLKTADKSTDPDSKRRSSHHDDKVMKETEIDGRARGKEGNERKRERTRDDKRERSRDKLTSGSGRHKRHRSSSVESRGRDSKNHAMASHANNSSNDESSEDSRRKSRSRKRKSSPSPVRSRRRHVSRSPHSKHSQRRHSPYSSLETTRRKKSRSKSPVRHKR